MTNVRDLVWAFLGLAIGIRSVPLARRRVRRLRASGAVFGEGHVLDSPVIVAATGLACGAAGWLLAARHDGDATVVAHFVLLWACATLALVDIDTHVLPRGIVVAATLLSFPLLVLAALIDEGSVFGVLAGAVSMWLLLALLAALSRGDLGGGDVALAFLLGGHLGLVDWWDVLRALAGAFVAGGVFALVVLSTGRGRRTRFAFGPFLIVASLAFVVR